MKSSPIYPGNTAALVVENLSDRAGNYITNATVTLIGLVDERGAAVQGITLPTTLAHVGNGTYEAEFPADLIVSVGKDYKATITAAGAGVEARWVETLKGQDREA